MNRARPSANFFAMSELPSKHLTHPQAERLRKSLCAIEGGERRLKADMTRFPIPPERIPTN